MISTLLAILKFSGILILVLLGILLALLLLVLFVPIRYKLTAHRKVTEEAPIMAEVKVTWLLHILNSAFSYPEAACLRIRLFCFTIFKMKLFSGEDAKSDPSGHTQQGESKKAKETGKEKGDSETERSQAEDKNLSEPVQKISSKHEPKECPPQDTAQEQNTQEEKQISEDEETDEDQTKFIWSKFVGFIRKLLGLLRNIRYTITGIYDKIRHIVNNIQYYIKIIKSDTFSRAWTVCSGQAFSLLKSIRPRKVSGALLIGTGDPASTGQVLAVYGILYPFIGDHIDLTPDFERQIVEGDLLVKGKITIFKALKTAWVIYFNRDLRRLIKLFKREAA